MNKYKEKGFTLIELLAVIAILAIVMIIAVPTVLNTIATAKKGAFKDSVLAILKDAETKILESYTLGNDIKLPLTNEYVVIDVNSLNFENKNDYKGYILVTKEGDNFNLYPYIKQKEYCIIGVNKSNITTSDIVEASKCNTLGINNDIYIKDNKITTTVNGSPYKFAGQILINENIMTFDGTNNVIVNGLEVNTTSGAKNTVEFWMNWDGTNAVMPIGFKDYDLEFSSTFFGFNTAQGDIFGFSQTSFSNNWIHVAAVFYNGTPSSTNSKIYINGILQALSTKGGTHASRNLSNTMYISGWPNNSSYKFKGQIKSVRVWNTEISQTQIQGNMNKVISVAPNLVYSSDK